jgi:hypothetical protein
MEEWINIKYFSNSNKSVVCSVHNNSLLLKYIVLYLILKNKEKRQCSYNTTTVVDDLRQQ